MPMACACLARRTAMNQTTLYASPAERRNLPRRTTPTFLYPKSRNPMDPSALHAQRLVESWFPDDIGELAINRRDPLDRRKNALSLKRVSHWPRRVAWVLGIVSLVGTGLTLARYPIPRQRSAHRLTSYTTVRAQYQ